MAKKLSAKKLRQIAEAKITNAIYGLVIPMMTIPALYKALATAEAGGATEAELKALVAAFPGVAVTR